MKVFNLFFVSFYFRRFCQWPHSVDWGMGLKHLFFAGWVDWADVGTAHFCPLRKQTNKKTLTLQSIRICRYKIAKYPKKFICHSTETASLMLTCSWVD